MTRTREAVADPGAVRFGDRLKTWRRVNGLKQAALAEMLGVSQPAVARWERGIGMPAAARLKRLQQMMADSIRDAVALERLFIERQTSMRALIDLDGVRLLAVSEGFRRQWPEFARIGDAPMADHLVNEARFLFDNAEIRAGILAGSLGLASGVSERHTDLPFDRPIRHGWHVHFRRVGYRQLAEVVYEPCAADRSIGVTDLVYVDTLGDGEP